MHPYLSYKEFLSQSEPSGRAYRRPANAGGALNRWMSAAARRWRRRKMIAALSAMDDRILKDIGIYRGDIARVVDGFDDRELAMVPVAQAPGPVAAERESFRKAA